MKVFGDNELVRETERIEKGVKRETKTDLDEILRTLKSNSEGELVNSE